MARKKRRKHSTEEEQLLIRQNKKPTEQGQQEGQATVADPLAPAQLQQMQKQYGNAFVQRYVADQSSATAVDEEPTGQSEVEQEQETSWMPEPEPLKFQSHVRMIGPNTLELDLAPVLQSEKMGLDRREFEMLLKKWAGIGFLNLGSLASTQADEIKLQASGKLELPVEGGMSQQMRTLGEEAGLSELARTAPFGPYGTEVEANLFFSRETLLDMDLPETEKFLNSEQAKQSEAFLLLNLEGTFLAGGGNPDVQEDLTGFLLLAGEPR
ncbi:MAG: hypothetical protein AAF902_26915 [Chloroflexota bacterium]